MALQLACKATSRACNKAQQRIKLEISETTVFFTVTFFLGRGCVVVYLVLRFLRLMLQVICNMSLLEYVSYDFK